VLGGWLLLGMLLGDAPVNYAVTRPGPLGANMAFVAELDISFGLMLLMLETAASARLSRSTGVFAGMLIATYITLETPLSGMSMNPARTFGSAFSAQTRIPLLLARQIVDGVEDMRHLQGMSDCARIVASPSRPRCERANDDIPLAAP
jgi:hypothetical protein